MRSLKKSLSLTLLLLLVLAPALRSAPAFAADVAATKQLEMKARESFAAGRYDEALQTFAKLYAETLHPVYLRNIGRCHQKMREPQKAIDAFQDYLAKTKTGKDKITADERAEIDGYIKDMQALIDADKAAAATPVLAAPVQPLPGSTPPTTTTAAPLLAAAPPPTEPTAAPAIAATPESESHPVYTRWWFWTIIGAAVAGGVVTAVVLSKGTSQPACPSGVTCAAP
ncbi:MAG TPA: tetratricopeptide repeat protein [Polyangia bacterium]|nr:tetratricopeptide repeat protein [Polyangia bacterium]